MKLVDAQVLASLAALEGPTAAAGAEALTEMAQRSGQHRVSGYRGLAGGPPRRMNRGVGAGVPAVLRARVQSWVRELLDARSPGFAGVALTEREDL